MKTQTYLRRIARGETRKVPKGVLNELARDHLITISDNGDIHLTQAGARKCAEPPKGTQNRELAH